VHLAQGAEMGRFLLGSTVVMLFPRQTMAGLRFNPVWAPGGGLRMGGVMAEALAEPNL
jgi:phosphatidylserine decarboxylase